MNYLLSYPRSGNSWFRYCVENICKQRTIGYLYSDLKDKGIMPEYRGNNHYILIKRHETSDIENTVNNKLLFILRDYNEVIIRHRGSDHNIIKEHEEKHLDPFQGGSFNYISTLEFYEQFIGDKLLIYYEDLVQNTEQILYQAISFLTNQDRSEDIINFTRHIVEHKQKSIALYGASKTKGNLSIKHSAHISQKQKKIYSEFLKQQYSLLFEKYLYRYEP
jgi:hypothetical protein